MREKIEDLHFKLYGRSGQDLQFYFCPGRVNFIGEHIDYNDGNVMPFAITQGIYASVETILEKKFYLSSEGFESVEINFDQIEKGNLPENWSIYPLSGAAILSRTQNLNTGLKVTFVSNLPKGSGLSSSAAIEVIFGFILKETQNWDINNFEIALAAQKAEWEFPKVKCGIMDQFAVAMGKKNHLIKLNCEKLNYVYLPIDTKTEMLILDTQKPRTLAASAYNQRVLECKQAFEILYMNFQIETFKEAKIEMIDCIADKILKKRVRHIITEIERVEKATKYLEKGLVEKLGQLLNESHYSLKDDYEVSCTELDIITEIARKSEGCFGARMTGAGFGGCAIALVNPEFSDTIIQNLINQYESKIGHKPKVYKTIAEDGVRKL